MSAADLFRQATQAHQRNDLVSAESLYRQVLVAQPEHADAWHLLGVALGGLRRLDEAERAIDRAIALRPTNAVFIQNLAEVHRHQGRLDDAVAAFQRALALDANLPETHFNLANVLKTLGRHEEAIACYRQALALRPVYPKASYNLGNTLYETGRSSAAVEAFQAALRTRPDWADALTNLGNALQDLGEVDRAIEAYSRAAALEPSKHELQLSLATAHLVRGDVAAARRHHHAAAERSPKLRDDPLHRLRSACLIDVIPADEDAIDATRRQLLRTIEELTDSARPDAVDLAELHHSGAEPPMVLAYHARDDLPIRRAHARLIERLLPTFEPPTRRGAGPPHVGIVVTRGHEGVFHKCLGGIVDQLPSTGLRISLVCSRSGANILRQWVKHVDVRYVVVPERIDLAAETIRAAEIDLLHYWEVGTDSTNYCLPTLRATPVQTATWGWPVTTGLSAIDAYICAAALEPENADAHYTERLIRLPSLPTRYRRPPAPTGRVERSEFGVSSSDHLYVCPQNLRKLQPSFDAVLAELLRGDPAGRLLLIADAQPNITARLQQRLTLAMPDVIDRVRILPRMPEREYLRLLSCWDVWLDPPGYGGGANTVYDAVAAGVPMVTLPGAFHRGRWCAAVCRAMGCEPCMAADEVEYVRQARELAGNADLRESIRTRMHEAESTLFDDPRPAAELAEAWRSLLAAR